MFVVSAVVRVAQMRTVIMMNVFTKISSKCVIQQIKNFGSWQTFSAALQR